MFSFSVSSTGNNHTPKPHYTKYVTSTQCIKSAHAYKLIPLDVVIILKNFSARILCIFLSSLSCIFSFVTIFVCRVTLYFNSTMAEANGIRDLPKQGVQSILKGFSIDDSERSLPQVPNETLGLVQS